MFSYRGYSPTTTHGTGTCVAKKLASLLYVPDGSVYRHVNNPRKTLTPHQYALLTQTEDLAAVEHDLTSTQSTRRTPALSSFAGVPALTPDQQRKLLSCSGTCPVVPLHAKIQ
jgi:hypothetical protein